MRVANQWPGRAGRGVRLPVLLSTQAVIFIKVRADFAADKAAAGLEVVVPMPKEVQRVSCEYEQDVQPTGNQSWDWQEKQHRLVWKHKKVKGSTEWTLRVSLLFTISATVTTASGYQPCIQAAAGLSKSGDTDIHLRHLRAFCCMHVTCQRCHWPLLSVIVILQVRATLEDSFTNSVRQGVGPINLNFAIPMHCASKLQVRYLQIMKHDKNYSPYRWVRYVTMSNSYVIRTR